ncbi:unnamed protein product [Owenia fusiformis]|uniref:Phytanoyl-CoA dioxygenase n=1 Tax=Owenia fusiformis TaxID=6347 RepID=A0A8S4P183_OWEFU|nr:unnamed protein product [Owenia fusiformis]
MEQTNSGIHVGSITPSKVTFIMLEGEVDTSQMNLPGFTDEAYPDIFNTIPPQPSEKKPGQLTPKQLEQFFDKGYVLIKDYLNVEELNACKDAIDVMVDDLAEQLFEEKKIKRKYREFGFYQRLARLEEDCPGACVMLHKLGKLPKAFRDLWSNEKLLNMMEQLIGPNIAGHPVWNLRPKVPQNEATTVPWHQDCGYLDSDSYSVLQPTAWIPLLDATEKNGCLQVIRNSHKSGKVAKHNCCWGTTHYVMLDEEESPKILGCDLKKDRVTCEVPFGGLLLFNNLVVHRSLNNLSDTIRWSLDLRWQTHEKLYGFYDLKFGIPMRKTADPLYQIDWSEFNVSKKYDTSNLLMPGPWMNKWPITHHNQHTKEIIKAGVTRPTWHN